MESSALERALSSALTALGAIPEKDLRHLSLVDCTFMLNALPGVDSLSGVRKQLAARLHKHVSIPWVEHGDAYEVYSVLTALWRYNLTYVEGEWLAAAIQRLVRTEVAVGGPYYIGTTIAVAANVQIAIFISLIAKPLPNLSRFFASVIATKRFDSTELTSFGLLYLLATACDNEELRQYAQAHWHTSEWQTSQHTVVALAILKDSLPSPESGQTLVAVCRHQQPNGLWAGEPFVKNTLGKHSDFVTTSLIAEALYNHLYAAPESYPARWRRKRQDVARAAQQLLKTHPEPLRSSALAAVKRVCKADQNFEITLLPQFFARALDSPERFTNDCYTTLGLANLCTWIAYTIYDDFIDSEGTPAELPVANIAMRASLDCFRTVLPEDAHFQRYVGEVFAGMDEANAWEVNNCRFAIQDGWVAVTELPRYGRCKVLAARAFAHALPPMAILAQHSPRHSAKKSRYIEMAFQHYLIARQLNDDLHDWIKDMQAGQASYVVTAILRDMRIENEAYDMEVLLPAMQKCFRRTTMPKICKRMLWHIDLSKQQFAKSRLLQRINDIYPLLDTLEQSAQQSLDRRAKSQALGRISSAQGF